VADLIEEDAMIGDYNNVKADRLVNAEVQNQNRMWGPTYERADSNNRELMLAGISQLVALDMKQRGDKAAFSVPPLGYPETWSGFRDYGSDIANLVVAAAFLHQEIARKLRAGEDYIRTPRDPKSQPYTGDQPKEL
jgi:hypothetical protein